MNEEERSEDARMMESLLILLSEQSPEVVDELRVKIASLNRSSYSQGFEAGRQENNARLVAEDRETFLRGQAKGMVWAYHTVRMNGTATAPENPYVHENIVKGLMNPRKLMR